MKKQNYQNLEEERTTELPPYNDNIPIGQPVNPYAQAPQHYQPQFQQPPHIQSQQMQPVIMQQALPPPPAPIGMQAYNYPTMMNCPCCKMQVTTVVNLESGNTTYMWCAFIGICSPPFCCLPFIMDSCLDKSHYCPNCGHNILRKHQKCFEFMGC